MVRSTSLENSASCTSTCLTPLCLTASWRAYRNNREVRNIDPHPVNALIVKRAFELYATGAFTLLNREVDELNVYPEYKMAFDLIAERAKNEDWSGR